LGIRIFFYENIKVVKQGAPSEPLSKEKVLKEFANVFEGTGKLQGKYHLELDEFWLRCFGSMHILNLPGFTTVTKLDTHGVGVDTGFIISIFVNLRYRWLRMPFGISSAPEEYQRRQDQTVEGLPGVHSIIDDILIYLSSSNSTCQKPFLGVNNTKYLRFAKIR
jgi:hypothetical protein